MPEHSLSVCLPELRVLLARSEAVRATQRAFSNLCASCRTHSLVQNTQMVPTLFSALTAAFTLIAGNTDAQGKMTLPNPTCTSKSCTNAFSGTINGLSALTAPAGMSFKLYAEADRKAYTAAFNAQTKHKSLLDLVYATQVLQNGTSQECGFSLANGIAQPLPDAVEWTKLSSPHHGHCEVWCDNVLAFSDENCAINYPDNPAKLPYDSSKCTGASMLTSVWLALHVPTWQVYFNCVPLSGATAAVSSGSNDDASSTEVAAETSSASLESDGEDATSSSADSDAAEVTATSASYSDASDEISYADVSEESSSSSSTSTTPTPTSTTTTDTSSSSSSRTPTPTSTTTKCKAKATTRRRN